MQPIVDKYGPALCSTSLDPAIAARSNDCQRWRSHAQYVDADIKFALDDGKGGKQPMYLHPVAGSGVADQDSHLSA